MTATTIMQVVASLQGAGLQLVLTEDHALKVSPAHILTDELRNLIRSNKHQLIIWLGTDSVNDSQSWEALDRAYQQHHVNCKVCIAAGRGERYGFRCAVGSTLWRAYTQEPNPDSFNHRAGKNRWNRHNLL